MIDNPLLLAMILWGTGLNIVFMLACYCVLYRKLRGKPKDQRHWVALDYVVPGMFISIVCSIPGVTLTAQVLFRYYFMQ